MPAASLYCETKIYHVLTPLKAAARRLFPVSTKIEAAQLNLAALKAGSAGLRHYTGLHGKFGTNIIVFKNDADKLFHERNIKM